MANNKSLWTKESDDSYLYHLSMSCWKRGEINIHKNLYDFFGISHEHFNRDVPLVLDFEYDGCVYPSPLRLIYERVYVIRFRTRLLEIPPLYSTIRALKETEYMQYAIRFAKTKKGYSLELIKYPSE